MANRKIILLSIGDPGGGGGTPAAGGGGTGPAKQLPQINTAITIFNNNGLPDKTFIRGKSKKYICKKKSLTIKCCFYKIYVILRINVLIT